jgi:flagellar hook-associated protein 1 FlgK
VQDKQSELLRQLSEIADIDVLQNNIGGVDVTIGSGRALVIANQAYEVQAVSAPITGLAEVVSGGRTITDEISGGKIAGAIAARDQNIPDYQSRLDTVAYELVRQVNTIHQDGFDQLGNTNQNFFEPLAAVTGAARYIEVDATVAADGRRISAAGVDEAADNTTAQALAGLRDALVLEGNSATLVQGWSSLVYRVGRDTRAAVDGKNAQADIVAQIDALRDSVSGVSLDEEAMQMIKFQRAYEANARYFSAIDQSLSMLFAIVGR